MCLTNMIVGVGSTNPTKIEPVKIVFSNYFKDVFVKGVNVTSGVSAQPMTIDEMYIGALNRAKSAINLVVNAKYGVGIEGGLQKYSFGSFEQSLVVIVNKGLDIGIGSSGGLKLPDKIINKINSGKTLEQAIDEEFGTYKIGQGIGMFGVMTKGLVTRTEGVKHGVAFALSRFLHGELF